ncbi:hypothetical protein IB233_04755 [Comamonas sp. CMM01]|uniref:hypothetical protein n=1 Tax=Comamonas sp. CMM01 TaxID=2769280 RepID=UPI001781AEED|nr:hypothetical protein [Comamonas sp. CMM01]MBD9530947.1 hypothetical protein [Comamonas sp. CMM01]
MVIELTLSNVITVLALFVAALWALLKRVGSQQERRLAERFDGLSQSLASIAQAQDSNARATQELERQLLQHRVEMAKEYVRRDDYVRDIASLGTRIDNFALRVERALNHLGDSK